jgi:trimeric autotransporter adhesin
LVSGRFGSADYISPEMHLDKPYTLATDMWSLGVISYIILAGYPPFIPENEDDDMSIASAVINEDVQFPEEEWSIITPMAKDFIQRLLQKDPSQRMTSSQALIHPFMSGRFGDPVGDMMAAADKDAAAVLRTPRSEDGKPETVPNGVETTISTDVDDSKHLLAVPSGGLSKPSSPRAHEDASDTASGTESATQVSSSAEPSPRHVGVDTQHTPSDIQQPAAATTKQSGTEKPLVIMAIEVGGLAPHPPPQVLTARGKSAQDAAAAKRAQNLKQFNAKRRFAGAKNLFKFFSNKIFGGDSSSASGSTSNSKTSSSKSGSSSSTKTPSASPAPAPVSTGGDSSSKSSSKSSKRNSQQRSAPVAASASSPQLFKSKVTTPAATTTAPPAAAATLSTTPPQSHSPTGGSPKGSPRNSSPRATSGSPRGAGMVSSSSNPNLSSAASVDVSATAAAPNSAATKDSLPAASNQSQGLSGFALLKKRFESLVSSPPTPQQPAAGSKPSSSKQSKKEFAAATGTTSTQQETRSPSPEGRSRSATTVEFGPIGFEMRAPKRRSRHGAVDPNASLTAEDADLVVTPSADLLTPMGSDSPHKPSLIRVHSVGKEERRRSTKKVARQSSTKSDASGTSSQAHALGSLEEQNEPLSPKPGNVSDVASASAEVQQERQQPPTTQTPAPAPAAPKSRPPSTYDSFFGNLGSLSMSDLPSFSLETRGASTSSVPTSQPPVAASTFAPPAKASAPGTRGRTRSGTISVIGPGAIVSSNPVPTIEELRRPSPERPRSPSRRATKASVRDLVGNFESLKAQQDKAAAAAKPKKGAALVAAEKQQPAAASVGDEKQANGTIDPPAAAAEKPRKSPGSGLLRIMSVGIFNRKKVVSPASPSTTGTTDSSSSASPLSDSSSNGNSSPVSTTPKSSPLSRSKSTISMPKELQRGSELDRPHAHSASNILPAQESPFLA